MAKSRFELTVSPEYVPNWTIVEAVRELFQNALDVAETSEGKSAMGWEYDAGMERLHIWNENASLSKQSLLFGSTTKTDEATSIGKFGEGYKLAFLTLARLGYKVTVFNRMNKEKWLPKIIKSRRYGSDLLVVDTERVYAKLKSDTLTFTIEGVTQDDFEKISDSNLHIKPIEVLHETGFGNILKGCAGKIFIKGLFVCKKADLAYGYDILPPYIETNRDRDLIADFNLTWATSQMWVSADQPMVVSKMVKNETLDTTYVSSFNAIELSETMAADFKAMHGKYAIPVTTQDEYDNIKKIYKKLKPVFCRPQEHKVIYQTIANEVIYTATKREDRRYPKEIMEEFFDKHKYNMPEKTRSRLKDIVEMSKSWMYI